MADPLGFLGSLMPAGIIPQPQEPADPAIAEANTRAILQSVIPGTMPLAGPPPGLQAQRAKGLQAGAWDPSGIIGAMPETTAETMMEEALDPELARQRALLASQGPPAGPPGQLSEEEMQALLAGAGRPMGGGGRAAPLWDTSGVEQTLAGVRGARERQSEADRASEKRTRLEAEKLRIAEIKKASLEADASREAAGVMQGAMDGMALAEKNYKAQQDKAQGEVDRRMAAWDAAVKDRQAAKLDPDGWYKTDTGSPDWGRRIGSAIAVALGTLGSKLGGGENEALRIIQAAIARDLEAQRVALASKQQTAQDALTALGLAQKHMKDGQDQYQAARADMLQDTAFRLQMMAEKSKAPQLQAGAQALASKLQIEAEKTIGSMRGRAYQRELQGLQAEGVLQGRLSNLRAKNAAMAAGPGSAEPEVVGVAPLGNRLPKLSEAAKGKVREVVGNHAAAAASLDRLLEAREKAGATWIPFLRTSDGQAMVAEAVSSIAPLYGLSPDKVLKDPTLIGLPSDPEAIGYKLTEGARELRRGIDRRGNATLKGYGLRLDLGTQRRQRLPGG